MVLAGEVAESLIRLHQVRFEFFLNRCIHSGMSP
jgi:hypothetical protein